jgi:DNA repair photolyase
MLLMNMAKHKKKKKKKKGAGNFLEPILPFISDDRIMHAIFNAALAGIAWVAAREARKSAATADEMSEETQNLIQETAEPQQSK